MENIQIDDALLLRFFSDDVTSEERLAVNNWLDESGENQRIAQCIYYIRHAGDTIHAMQSVDARTDLGKVWKIIRNRSRRLWVVWMQRAAVIACLVLIPACIYLMFRDDHHQLAEVTMNVPEGSISSMVLPDGSKVWLNAGSHLVYGNGYGISDRRLRLSGEGFFEVKTDARLPLEVDADGIIIRARGTRFNVKAYPEEHTVLAILTDGIIEITSPGTMHRNTTLQPGQMAIFNKLDQQMAIESNVKTVLYTSWKDRRWLIEGTTLGELAPILQRRYAVKVLFDHEVLKTYKFRGEIQNLTAEQVARAIHLTAPMNYEMRNDTVFFTLNAKQKKEYDKIIK